MGITCCGTDSNVKNETPGQLNNKLDEIEAIANRMTPNELLLVIKF